MNKVLSCLVFAAGVVSTPAVLSAQAVLLYGWDFEPLVTPSLAKYGGPIDDDFNGSPFLESTVTTQNLTGRIYFDGQFGSTNFTKDVFNLPQLTTGDGTSNINTTFDGNSPLLDDFSTETTDPEAIGFDIQSGCFTFWLPTNGFENIELSMALRRGSQAATVLEWAWSSDGSSFSPFQTTAISSIWEKITLPLSALNSAVNDNASGLFIRGCFSGGTALNVPESAWYMDNIQVNGTAKPVLNKYILSIAAEGGKVTVNPNAANYDFGTIITLTAEPDPGYDFIGWSGDLTGTDNPIQVTMDADKAVTAVFQVVLNSFWIAAPVYGEIWRNSREAFPGEPGIGWIYDAYWPFVYMTGINGGDWTYIFADAPGSSAQNFFGYSFGYDFFFWGNNAWGYYFRYGQDEGYYPFN